MVAIKGTYDVLLVPLLMPVDDVLKLLPPQVRDIEPSPLISFTHLEIESLGLDTNVYNAASHHPVMLELGYQDHTGPGPRLLRPSFNEAKLDVLGMRHPNLGDHQPFSADKGFVFKQMILFSNAIMSTSSSLIAGLRSASATVTPYRSPSVFAEGEGAKIEYNVKDYIEATFSREVDYPSHVNGAALWAGRPWYGWRVSDTLIQFNFDLDNALIAPVPYKGDVRVKVSSFYDPTQQSKSSDTKTDWTKFDGVHAWRLKANYGSQDIKVDAAL